MKLKQTTIEVTVRVVLQHADYGDEPTGSAHGDDYAIWALARDAVHQGIRKVAEFDRADEGIVDLVERWAVDPTTFKRSPLPEGDLHD